MTAEIDEVVWIGAGDRDRDRCSPVVRIILDRLLEQGRID